MIYLNIEINLFPQIKLLLKAKLKVKIILAKKLLKLLNFNVQLLQFKLSN